FVGNDTVTMSDGSTSHFSVTVPRDDDNAHVARLAAEWRKLPFLPQLTGRIGVLRSWSGQNVKTLSPSLTDASSWAGSIGAGFEINRNLHVDVGFEYAQFDEITADTTSDILQGTYKTHVVLGSLGVNWRTDLGMRSK